MSLLESSCLLLTSVRKLGWIQLWVGDLSIYADVHTCLSSKAIWYESNLTSQ